MRRGWKKKREIRKGSQWRCRRRGGNERNSYIATYKAYDIDSRRKKRIGNEGRGQGNLDGEEGEVARHVGGDEEGRNMRERGNKIGLSQGSADMGKWRRYTRTGN